MIIEVNFGVYLGILLFAILVFASLLYMVSKKSSTGFENDDEIMNDEINEEIEEENIQQPTIKIKKIGKKKARKLQRKEEKRKLREYLEETRRRNEEIEKQRQKEERKKKKELEEQERRENEAWKEYLEKKEREDEEIYQEWKSQIIVESEGSVEMEMKEIESKSIEMVEYLKKKKIVSIEEFLGVFQIKEEKQVVEILDKMIKKENLFAFLDGNGKYVYITNEEANKIKDFIQSKGRVSISEIGNFANRIVDWSETIKS